MPPSGSDPLAFAIYAEEILACVGEALAVTGAPAVTGGPAPDCVAVTAALPAWDHCCDGGQLTVDLRRVWTTDRFPNQVITAFKCGVLSLVLEFAVTHLRCANQECVCCPAAELIAEQVLAARLAIIRALVCCFKERDWQAAIIQQVGLGPEGGCVGSETILYVGLPCPCGPCP